MPKYGDMTESLAQATGQASCGATSGMASLGAKPAGLRYERIQSCAQYDGKRFRNRIPTSQVPGEMGQLVKDQLARVEREPKDTFPVVFPELGSLVSGRGEELRLTWMGHSTVLLDIDGTLVLTDPVFGPRTSPVSFMGPKRFHKPPVEPEALPPLDVVLISHDHYNHLDYPTIQKLAGRETRFVTSLGVGAHLEHWGVPADRITELDWWESIDVGSLHITAAPSRHFSGRGPNSSAYTFWSSWALQGPKHSVWFSGDTGPDDAGFAEIGERFGGFDLTMIEVGAWHPSWGNIHLGPDNAARVHELVRGKTMMPVHWGTFSLALHAWDQPIVRMLELSRERDIELLSPMMGETVHREAGVAAYWLDRARVS